MPVCLICGQPFTKGQVLTITEEEMALIDLKGHTKDFTYCDPCFRILSNPSTAIELMGSLFGAHLDRAGVKNSETFTQKYKAWLLKRATKV